MALEDALDEDLGSAALDDLLAAAEEEAQTILDIPSNLGIKSSSKHEATSEMTADFSNANANSFINKENEENLDSSDDEDVRNFLERKYNEYGCDINKKLKQQKAEKHEAQVAKEVSILAKKDNTASIKNPHNPIKRQSLVSSSFKKLNPIKLNDKDSKLPNDTYAQTTASNSAVYKDPIFGLRIISPLISSDLLTERMAGRTPIRFSAIPFHIERGDLSKDWVIAGVLVSKGSIKTSANGSLYSIWKISDLTGDIKMVSLFLFKSAHKELWKTSTGMAIAVLNPTVFEKRSDRDIACLSIDASQKVMVLGQSKDLGICKAKKKNGEPCSSIINTSDGEFCIFHIKQEFSNMSKRAELQSATAGRGLNQLRNKVLGKNEVFYAGQSFSAIPAKKNNKLLAKDSHRLESLSKNNFTLSFDKTQKSIFDSNKTVPYAVRSGPPTKLAANVEPTTKQRLKDVERLKILQSESSLKPENFVQNKSQSSLSIETPKLSLKERHTETAPLNLEFSFMKHAPCLKSEGFSLEVTIPEKQARFAKLKAVQAVKQNPIKKTNPNFIRGTHEGKKRAIDELNKKYDSGVKRQKLDEEQRDINRKSRIQRIMDASSSHQNLLISRDLQEQDKYFNKLEKKEALEEKMLNTFRMPCKAVVCIKCKYTAFSAADRCKDEKHPLKLIDAEKRFFQCEDCGNRTTTVQRYPQFSCNNCQNSRWKRVAMIRERKVEVHNENLSIRGDEETFIGSLGGKSNLNLLVPED